MVVKDRPKTVRQRNLRDWLNPQMAGANPPEPGGNALAGESVSKIDESVSEAYKPR
ncbi:hypothetical protein BSLA_01r4872 [Burkholderia stabilis]|nr:hypothetical protein BSLA_01r4872 [Burkholderia stabilis]